MNNKKALFIILSLSFIACILNTSKVTALTSDDCIKGIKTKLNAESVDIKSIDRMCSEISGKGFLGMMWFDQNSNNDYGNKDATDKTELELKDEYQQLTAHGFVVFDNKNLGVEHTYATKIELHACTNKSCEKITEGLSNDGHLFESNAKIKPTWTDTEKPEGWPTCSAGTQGCPINGWMSRGIHVKGKHFSEGGFENFKINTKIIKDKYFPKSTEKMTIEVYRCMGVQYSTNEPSDGKNVDMAVGACGYDPSTITISNTPDTFSVSSQVRGKKSTSSKYSSWSSSYSNKIQNGDPDNTDTWNIQFKHTLTINGTNYTISQASDCPSGYSCTFSGSPNLNPSLKSAGKITGEQSLSVKQNSTKTTKSSKKAKYEVSKTTTQTSSDTKTITYNTICSTTSPDPTIIDYSTEKANATFYASSGSLETDISRYPQKLKDYINDNLPTSYYETQTANKALENGQQDTLTYNDFHKKKYTINYTKTITDDGTGPKTTYNITGYSGPKNGSVVTCPTITIYREAQAEIQIKNAIKATSDASTIVNGNNITEYTSNSNRNVSTQIDTNNPDTKIYVGSSNSDSIEITTTHYIKRSDGGYDANYSINVPWTTVGDITDINTSPTSIQYNSERELNPISKTISNSEIELGKYDYQVADTFQSNDRLTIKYGKVTEESGTPISATATAHLYRPWNYNLSFTSIESTSNGGKLYLNNEKTSVTLKLQNKNNIGSHNDQEGNPSYSPETTISLHQVTILDSNLADVTDISDYIQDLESNIKNGTIPGELVGNSQTKIFNPDSYENEVKFENVSFNQADIGDHICLYATANHTNSYEDTKNNPKTYYYAPTENTLYSSLTCFTIAGFPIFQVRGGSILTEGNVKAKVVESKGNYFGSWIDYGLVTKGNIEQLSSGKAFIGTEYTYPKNHPLTIANNEQNGNEPKGQSNISASATKERLKSLYAPSAKTPLDGSTFTGNSTYGIEVNVSKPDNYTTYTSNQFTTQTSDTNAKYRYTYINKPDSNTIIEQGSALPKGVTHVIYSTGNIVIGNDFTYKDDYTGTNAYSQISDIPQYIIIADGNIYIDQAVKEVHAWLIADGEINTCTGYTKWQFPNEPDNALHKESGGYDSTTYNKDVCNSALAIYGPIFAKNIWLERTSVSGVTGVSEIVNLTAENYYWALAQSKGNGKISTSYTRSLAPRY